MAEELFEAHAPFREVLERCDEALAADLSPGLLDILYGSARSRALVHRTDYGNPVFFALEYALARLWMSWDITPAYVIGHSVGEFAAACTAGVFRMEDGIRLVAKQGKMLHALPSGGGMLAVGTSAQHVADAMGTTYPTVSVAAENGPGAVVLSGERAEIGLLQARFAEDGVRTSLLNVSQAFHSPHMNPVLGDLLEATHSVRFRPPRIPYISSLTGTLARDELCDGTYWVKHLANPVRFLDGMRCLFGLGPTDFIEIGPGSTLLRMGQQCAPRNSNGHGRRARWVPSIHPDGSDRDTFAAGLVALARPVRDATRPASTETFSSDPKIAALVRRCVVRLTKTRDAHIHPQRPLSEYGMDSLMSVEFAAAVQRETDVRLPPILFANQLTVEDVCAYIEHQLTSGSADATRTDHDVLVPFREVGEKPPLFFVPAGDGDLFAFRDVAALLETDQPAYGLQPPHLKDVGTLRDLTIGQLTAQYVRHLTSVQPEGPYHLAGYSAGGIVAVEVARLLHEKGQSVDLLAILDSPPHLPRWVGLIYTGLSGLCSGLRLPGLARRWDSRWLKRRLHAIIDEGLRAHVSVVRGHEVAPYPGRITYFRPRRSWIRGLNLTIPGMSWSRVAQGGIEERWMPGTHYEMFRGGHLEVLAASLTECLRQSDRQSVIQRRSNAAAQS